MEGEAVSAIMTGGESLSYALGRLNNGTVRCTVVLAHLALDAAVEAATATDVCNTAAMAAARSLGRGIHRRRKVAGCAAAGTADDEVAAEEERAEAEALATAERAAASSLLLQ
jgi:hypothetical protein